MLCNARPRLPPLHPLEAHISGASPIRQRRCRTYLRELRGKCQRGLYNISGMDYTFHSTQQGTREERQRNKKLVRIAELLQAHLHDT